MSAKNCQACRTEKDSGEFYAMRSCADGRDTTCKACKSESAKARRRARAGMQPVERQTCAGCGVDKPRVEFHRNVLNTSGLAGKCKSCVSANARMYRAANSDTLTAANRAWREGNRDWMVAYRRARYLADPASFKAAANAWRRGNPEAYKAIKHRQRARRRGAYARLTRLQWAETVAQFNGACAYCLKPTPRPTIDHMVPLCRGGEHTVENVVPACSYCNTSKGARSIFAMLPRCGVSA